MKGQWSKLGLYQLLTGVFVGSLIISNILASKTFEIFDGVTLPCAVFIFPVAYIVNDVLCEVFGLKRTRRVIYLGFAMNLLAVLMYELAMALPAPEWGRGTSDAFSVVLGSSARILIGSFAAYLVGSLLNAWVMDRMKARDEKHLFARCIGSTVVGEGLDAVIFLTIAFAGTMAGADLMVMIVAQATFKILYEVVCYPVTRQVIVHIKRLPETVEGDLVFQRCPFLNAYKYAPPDWRV